MLFMYTFAAVIAAESKYEPAVWLVVIVWFTGPAAFVAITFLLLDALNNISFKLQLLSIFSDNLESRKIVLKNTDHQMPFIYVPVDHINYFQAPNQNVMNSQNNFEDMSKMI